MKNELETKLNGIITSITSDRRWNNQDELMTQVFGFTIYGLSLALGRLTFFLNIDDIHEVICNSLTNLGIGEEYAKGLVDAAHNAFTDENNNSYQSELVTIGHSHYTSDDSTELINSIFENTELLKNQME